MSRHDPLPGGGGEALPRAPTVEVRWQGGDLDAARQEVLAGLRNPPRVIPSKLFYDDLGSTLFDAITRLPEYYQTRTEAEILERYGDEIAERTGASQVVELGSGTAVKTRLLLDPLWRQGTLRQYVPLDVSEGLLRRVAGELAEQYPGLEVHGIVGDFLSHVEPLPATRDDGPRLALFLGGTIGNLHPERQAPDFLRELAVALDGGDYFLLGVDLIKDPAVLEAAYDDSQGVTARFNRNILAVVNTMLGADFEPHRFDHLAVYDRDNHWIEMRLVAREAHEVRLGADGERVRLGAGEAIRTEISAKFDEARVRYLLGESGFELLRLFADPRRYFALALCRRLA